MRIFVIACLAISINSAVAQDASHKNIWISFIKQHLGQDCEISEPVVTGKSVFGNNGYTSQEWTIDTCKGKKHFTVFYQPKSDFPDKIVEYRVIEK